MLTTLRQKMQQRGHAPITWDEATGEVRCEDCSLALPTSAMARFEHVCRDRSQDISTEVKHEYVLIPGALVPSFRGNAWGTKYQQLAVCSCGKSTYFFA